MVYTILNNLCYTVTMQERTFWLSWAHFLQRWGVRGLAADLLEAGGPLTIFLSQLVYMGQPLFGRSPADEGWVAFAKMLEDQDEVHSFAAFLRKEVPG
jgi:hypothetical protein